MMKSTQHTRSEHGDAIELLRAQHREMEEVLEILARTKGQAPQGELVAELADLYAVHLAVEERIFYPGIGWTSVEDHAELEQLLARLVAADRAHAPADDLAQQ